MQQALEVLKGLPNASVGYSIFSPPFASLYTYSNSPRDMGNVRDDARFSYENLHQDKYQRGNGGKAHLETRSRHRFGPEGQYDERAHRDDHHGPDRCRDPETVPAGAHQHRNRLWNRHLLEVRDSATSGCSANCPSSKPCRRANP